MLISRLAFLINLFILAESFVSPFNHWHCIDFIQNIDKSKPYAFNVGDMPLVTWFNNSEPITTVNICKHMGSKLESGKVQSGCLVCPYHGLSHNSKDAFGKSMIFEDKLWWSYKTVNKLPPRVPYYDNKKFETTLIKVDVDANIMDCALNIMDVNHPAFVHNNIFGFGSNVPPTNLKTFSYNKHKIGLAFDYKSNSNLAHLKNELRKSHNFNVYEYPYTSWSRVSLPSNEHLIVNINMLPIGPNKTRWLVTLKHNFLNKSLFERKLMEFAGRCILIQDQMQMKKQAPDNMLKHSVMYQKHMANEDHMKDLRKMFKDYEYPDMMHVIRLYNYHKGLKSV